MPLLLLLPLSGHPSEASDNDNVAFGIPTDLETSLALERGGRARARGGAQRINGVFVVVVVEVGGKHFSYILAWFFRGGTLKCSLAKTAFARKFEKRFSIEVVLSARKRINVPKMFFLALFTVDS